nr:protein ANTAGONIST OF LIKE HETEROCHROMATIN PROTEIN 1-like [Leptinotarsa decemlineata]
MITDYDVAMSAMAVVILALNQPPKRRQRFWIRPSLRRGRQLYRASELMKYLILDEEYPLNLEYRNDVGFTNFFRMQRSDFQMLLNKVGPKISKKNTSYRDAIPASERLAVTLRFIATGDSYHSLMYVLKISKQCISKIVPEVCDAIVEALQDYIKLPQSEAEWNEIAQVFEEKCNFPNCIGAIDGKHIALVAPFHSGSEFFNYKGFFSIVLMAVVDANYNFIYVRLGSASFDLYLLYAGWHRHGPGRHFLTRQSRPGRLHQRGLGRPGQPARPTAA